ncbi:MAG TPA: biotin/lipoyl-binding protein, partial [Opitutaceae bacterium]|nr:biotin/lipoyl-binding protein [Opitutaceae bacterium]
MPKPSRLRGPLFVLILIAAATGGWFYYQRGNAPKPVFTTATVSRGTISQVVTASGTLQPVTSVEVGSQISGLVTEVLADYNSPVKTGQLIARIDASSYEQRLRQAEADLASAQANHALVRLNTERTRALRQSNLVSQQELDQANAQLAQADANLLTREAA